MCLINQTYDIHDVRLFKPIYFFENTKNFKSYMKEGHVFLPPRHFSNSRGMCTYAHSYYISCSYAGLSSDLKKSTVVDESFLFSNQCSVLENTSTIIWKMHTIFFLSRPSLFIRATPVGQILFEITYQKFQDHYMIHILFSFKAALQCNHNGFPL